MKIRDSGMPEREYWETFFDPIGVLSALGLDDKVRDAAEFGCGYGTFTLRAAQMIRGDVHAFDIDPEMVRMTAEEASRMGLHNVDAVQRDFVSEGTGLPDGSVDYAMLFNILHHEDPKGLLSEARRILRGGGRLGIIHWIHDERTPRGPSLDMRPKPEQCLAWAQEVGFRDPVQRALPPYHYGIVLFR